MLLTWNRAGLSPLLVILLQSLVSPTSSGQHSTMCYECHDLKESPQQCTHVRKCGHNEVCHTEVYEDPPGHFTYYLGCMEEDECPVNAGSAAIVGRKRADHHPGGHVHHHHHELLRCSQCCRDGTPCNRNLCSNYNTQEVTTTIKATTVQPPISTVQSTADTSPSHVVSTAGTSQSHVVSTAGTSQPHVVSTAGTSPPIAVSTAGTSQSHVVSTVVSPSAAVYDPNCVDHEEDGITCITLNLFNVCTDTSPFAYVIAHEKCKKFCGFCITDPNAPTNAPGPPPNISVCTDYEQDGIRCASMDLFSFCTDGSSLAYVLAHEKCRKHCGVCTSSVIAVSSTLPSTTRAATAQTATVLTTATSVAAVTQQATTVTNTASQTNTSYNTDTYAPAMVTVIATQQPPMGVSTGAPCVDVEENGFNCAYMDAFNICSNTEPMFNTLAHEKCSKHCGFC